ncbi:hypothetical protein EVAR_86854_1 [Eumeta japonica]|uniref:Uncharacterized protein n=1 Tax=Eumeta variegata TaxID=151549 RepID=A0A4C1VVF5_EUMVA|nr:hypothetical protein EVAR_86854_1 [Eumeta japonica]
MSFVRSQIRRGDNTDGLDTINRTATYDTALFNVELCKGSAAGVQSYRITDSLRHRQACRPKLNFWCRHQPYECDHLRQLFESQKSSCYVAERGTGKSDERIQFDDYSVYCPGRGAIDACMRSRWINVIVTSSGCGAVSEHGTEAGNVLLVRMISPYPRVMKGFLLLKKEKWKTQWRTNRHHFTGLAGERRDIISRETYTILYHVTPV